METGHSENVLAAWFKQKTGKEIHRSVVGKSMRAGFHELDIDGSECKEELFVSEFVGDNIALFSEEGYRTLLQIMDKIQTLTPKMLKF